jgi:hypothetical protein
MDGWTLCLERPTIQTGYGVHPILYISGLPGWCVQNLTLTSDLFLRQRSEWVHQNLYSLHTSSKCKVHSRNGHESPEGENIYSFTLSLTSALDRDGWLSHRAALPPVRKPFTCCQGGWLVPRVGLDGCGKYRPHRDLIPVPSIPWRVAIATEILWHTFTI